MSINENRKMYNKRGQGHNEYLRLGESSCWKRQKYPLQEYDIT